MLADPPTTTAALRELLEGSVVRAAAGLIGCRIVAAGGLALTIVETEAYHELEPAAHGFGGHTPRAAKLRRPAGSAYVYLSYGMHQLVNVVTGSQDVASAVLLRGAVALPELGGAAVPGPGRLGKVLGAGAEDDGHDLLAGRGMHLEPAEPGDPVVGARLAIGPRIGITKATALPWRFALSGSAGVSMPRI